MRIIHRDIVGKFFFSADDKVLLGKNRKGGVYDDCYLVGCVSRNGRPIFGNLCLNYLTHNGVFSWVKVINTLRVGRA